MNSGKGYRERRRNWKVLAVMGCGLETAFILADAWRMISVTFLVTPCSETGGFVARWDDPAGGGITTQGESIADLETMIRDAVGGYFVDRPAPRSVRLHFVEDPELAVA